MCDFGISETIAGIASAIGIGAEAGATAGAVVGTAAGAATAATAGVEAGVVTGELASLLGVTTSTAEASALVSGATTAAAAPGLSTEAILGLTSLGLSVVSGGASGGVSAKQSKEQGTLIKANARAERRNVLAQANVDAEANAQKNFQLSTAALAARGGVNAANLGDRSVRAIGRAVGFELGTDKATVKRNQEISNQVASARLLGIDITKQGQRLQVGNPATIAGVGAVNALAGGLNAGAGAYNAFSKFKIPTDGPNLAFV
jgi:hypothetical protein